jgi:hypothetical protein
MTDDDDEEESRPTMALHRDDILGPATPARRTHTEGMPPLVIVDRPQEVVNNAATQRDVATRMMQPIELHSMGHAPIAPDDVPAPRRTTHRIPKRQATGVAIAAPKLSPYVYLWVVLCVAAVAALIHFAP